MAVSCLEPTVTDAKNLLALGCACRRAGAALALLFRRLDAEARRGERVDNGEASEVAALGLRAEEAAQVLQDLSQDAALLALLPHRARFADLLAMADAMDGGAIFVATYPSSVVVAAEEHTAARPVTIVQRLGRVARRLTVFRMAA